MMMGRFSGILIARGRTVIRSDRDDGMFDLKHDPLKLLLPVRRVSAEYSVSKFIA